MEMLKTYQEPLSHELMKRYHYKLKSGVFENIANGYLIGEYRTAEYRIGYYNYAAGGCPRTHDDTSGRIQCSRQT